MLQLLTIGALVFFGSSIINVILNTIKSIVTIKGSTQAAAIMNAVTFGFYTIIVKQISDFDLVVTVPITILANLFGVYLAKWILHFFQKDKLWRISCTVLENSTIIVHEIQQKLNKYNIKSIIVQLEQPYGHIIEIFSKTQGESELIKENIKDYKLKYTIYEVDKTL